jgi:guanylate kinase
VSETDPESGRGARALILVLSSPTGGGKTTIARKLVERDHRLRFSVSHTTRAPRPGERDGVDYHFVADGEFRSMAQRGEFLEWAEVHSHLYGTHLSEADAASRMGADLLLDIDVQGGLQVRRAAPDSVLVFVIPPSLDVLLGRLASRAGEAGFDLARRLGTAVKELEVAGSYDYNIINEDLDAAVSQVQCILDAARMRTPRLAENAQALRSEILHWLRSRNVHGE